MEAVVLDRMELELMHDCHVGLAVVKLDVDDVGGGSVGDSHEIPFRDCEEDVLDSLSVKVARDETLPADRFDHGLVSDFADLAVKFKMLHCFYLKMCYSTPVGPGPHCTKNAWALLIGWQRYE